MRQLWCGFLLMFLVSCATIRVDYDYDKKTDFTNYTTYNYYPDMKVGLSELDTKRLLRAMDSMMRTKGMLLSEEPDFLINIQSSNFLAGSRNTIGVGVGSGGRNVGGGISFGVPVGGRKIGRQILFDLIDTQKDALFWQGTSESSYRENASPEERERTLMAIVQKVFSRYPPQKK